MKPVGENKNDDSCYNVEILLKRRETQLNIIKAKSGIMEFSTTIDWLISDTKPWDGPLPALLDIS